MSHHDLASSARHAGPTISRRRLARRRGLLLIALALTAMSSTAGAEPFDQISISRPSPRVTVYTIAYPNVRQPVTRYPSIVFEPGDVIRISAGGCVQTGGHGKTWKRYLNPSGSNADELYSAMVRIDGITSGRQRLQLWADRELVARARAMLELGYQDDNYGDNGYTGHDDGTEDQCRNIGAASVRITVTRGAPATPPAGPRYNEVYQHSTHNAYEAPKPSLREQLGRFHIHSLEIDIHTGKGPGNPAPPGGWFVYHMYGIKEESSCPTLAACLGELAAWHRAAPRHEVVTIFVDLKDGFGQGHGPAELDAAFRAALGTAIMSPSELARPCAGPLRSALAQCKWPELTRLRGTFLFVLTGSDDQLLAYQRGGGGLAFIAPEISSPAGIAAHPTAIFFNLNSDHFVVGRDIMAAGHVSRVYYYNTPLIVHGINDANNWSIAVNNSIHHIATDELDAPWSRTANAQGWPFACMRQDCRGLAPEPAGIGR
jgi:hypothetical protein